MRNKQKGDDALKQISQSISRKDSDAFTKLYTIYFGKLVLLSVKYVKNTAVAEEIVQDIFVKIWESPSELSNILSLKSYLARSVINASINHIKRQKNIEAHHLTISKKITAEYFIDEYEEQEFKERIYNEIEQLPEHCKKVFKLNRFEGLKYREIALLLNISEKTVEYHMMNALKILRTRLSADEDINYSKIIAIINIIAFELS